MNSQRLLFALPALLSALTIGQARAQFSTRDVRIGDPSVSYLDFEFWQQGRRICFQDETNACYVGVMDSVTGNLATATGRDFLVDNALAPVTQSLNGPEWGIRQGGADVFYTRQVGSNRSIGRGTWNGTAYVASDLSAALPGRRFATLASKNPTDAVPTLVYAKGNSLLNFTVHHSPAVGPVADLPVPYATNSSSGPRFIDGEQALLTNDIVAGTTQIFRFDLATAQTRQLTFDAGSKIDAFSFVAPDFGGSRMLFCTVGDAALRLYREVATQFVPQYDIVLPDTAYHYLFSAEPFVFRNESYLFVCAAQRKFIPGSQTNSLPADVWLIGLGPGSPSFRKLSDNRSALRLDPEVFLTPTEAYVYYYEYNQNGNVHPVALHKCATGLASLPLGTAAPLAAPPRLEVFPNPAQGVINVSAASALRELFVYDARGRLVFAAAPNVAAAAINSAGFAEGLYFIRARTATESLALKVIVKN